MTRTTAWDVWCPYCQRYWFMWRWTATGKASEYAPKRVCLQCGHHIGDANEMVQKDGQVMEKLQLCPWCNSSDAPNMVCIRCGHKINADSRIKR